MYHDVKTRAKISILPVWVHEYEAIWE